MKRTSVTLILSAIASASCYATTTLLSGGSIEFTSPDDLRLDPATAVVAVDVYGNADSVVNGVTFQTDGQAAGSGTVTNGGVTVVTTAVNQINDWAVAPAFTGGTGDSAANLANIMGDIRWTAAPDPVTVNIMGLNPGTVYNVQLLFNEGRDRLRQFDISVDGDLVADNYTSRGAADDAVWTTNNSFAYFGDFEPGADGTLNIILQADIAGGALNDVGADGNPTLQGVIVHTSIPEPSSSLLGLIGLSLLAYRRRR